ncbi:oligosaccharide flippase family protein [Halogeometricum luteum]|uniref:Oligosaccharide flippase family protein n=1 Tax=Halogeometricum luteum TaxID=2950537 RepID=A0ABU2G488_9EURY|nr:oligosaccharide flippase family protein [Halogeometricum sp. S3BR5-2]MDS0295296.1 oligosaccharide flippase family protein [Halogeometricum sp. S3BR5-2]
MNQSISKLSSITFLGKLAGRGFEYGLIVLIGRALGAEALGRFTVAVVVLQIAGFLAMLGLNTTVQRYVPIFRKQDDDERLAGLTLLGFVSPLLVGSLLAAALYFALHRFHLFDNPGDSTVLYALLLGVPLFAMFRIGEATTRGFKETKYAVYIRDFGQSGSAVLLVAVAVLLFGTIYSAAVAYLVSLGIGVLLSIVFLYRLGCFDRIRTAKLNLPETYRYSLPVAVGALSGEMLKYTDYLMLGVFVSNTEVGQYRAAFSTAVLITFAMASVSSIFPSVASELHHERETQKLDDLYTVVTKWITFLTAFAMLFFLVFSTELMSVFGEGFRQASTVLVVALLGQAVGNFVGPAGYLLLMSDHERVEMGNNVVGGALNVVLNFVLIREFGIMGAAMATSFSIGFQNLLRLLEVRYLLNIWPYSREYVRAVVPLTVALGVMLLGSQIGAPPALKLLLSGSIAGVVFVYMAINRAYTDRDQLLVASIK